MIKVEKKLSMVPIYLKKALRNDSGTKERPRNLFSELTKR